MAVLNANRNTVEAIRKASMLPDYANRRGGGRIGGGFASPDTYSGYFTVIKTATGVKVINGADSTATICGSFTAGSSNISCTATELALTGSGVVYLAIWYDDGLEDYDYEFGFAATLPSVDQEIYRTLASVASGVPSQVWIDGAMTDLNGSYVL